MAKKVEKSLLFNDRIFCYKKRGTESSSFFISHQQFYIR
jgi:hypothetical protein